MDPTHITVCPNHLLLTTLPITESGPPSVPSLFDLPNLPQDHLITSVSLHTTSDNLYPPSNIYVPFLNTLTYTTFHRLHQSRQPSTQSTLLTGQLLLASYLNPSSYGTQHANLPPSYPPPSSIPTLHLIPHHLCCIFPQYLTCIATVPKPLAHHRYHCTYPPYTICGKQSVLHDSTQLTSNVDPVLLVIGVLIY